MKSFRRIMLVVVAVVAVATSSRAQNALLATLNHNDTIQTFYGSNALQVALDSAKHGDVITLSAGTFIAKDIQKAVTIRGAGMGVGNSTEATVISGDFSINGLTNVAETLTLEGIYHNNTITLTANNTLKNPVFMKCRLKRINGSGYWYNWGGYYNNRSGLENATFLHCIVTEYFRLDNSCQATFLNSFVTNPDCLDGNSSNFTFRNCVIYDNNDTDIRSSVLNNTIVYSTRTNNTAYEANNTANNCVCIHDSLNVFKNITNTSNLLVTDVEDVFSSYRGTYADNLTFQLTDAAKGKYKGTDGTEVGMYGGSFPFDPATASPRITKCEVAPKSTADGKLSIYVEVSN